MTVYQSGLKHTSLRSNTLNSYKKSPVPNIIEKSMFGFMTTHILFVGDKLGIFDALSEHGTMNLEMISRLCLLPQQSLERFL